MIQKLSDQILRLCETEGSLKTNFNDLHERLKERSLGILILLLSFPRALPIPDPGYDTPFGIILMWIGALLLQGKQLQLPQKWHQKPFYLPAKIVRCGVKLIVILEKFVHPNPQKHFVKFLIIASFASILLILAFIMALPIPLTNTISAEILLLFGLNLLESDRFVDLTNNFNHYHLCLYNGCHLDYNLQPRKF